MPVVCAPWQKEILGMAVECGAQLKPLHLLSSLCPGLFDPGALYFDFSTNLGGGI